MPEPTRYFAENTDELAHELADEFAGEDDSTLAIARDLDHIADAFDFDPEDLLPSQVVDIVRAYRAQQGG